MATADWLAETGRDDPMVDLDMREDDVSVIEAITPLLNEFDSHLNETSITGKFWNNYLNAIEAMLTVIRAERSGDWKMYLDGLMAMLPTFFAYERVNYSRWLPIYITDMLDLEDKAPAIHDAFMQGQFSINRTGNSFTGVATDQVLEQTMNKDSKGSGGLKGISLDADACTKWFLTSHIRAHP